MTNAPAAPPHADDDLFDEGTPLGVMPGTVRGARLIAGVAAAVGVVLIAITIALGTGGSLGALIAGYLPTFALIPLVLLFGRGGDLVRKATVGAAALAGLVSCTGILTGLPPGAVGIVANGAVAALLLRPSAQAWFTRER
ncbi:hypothetical protein [Nocardia rhizosphaerihabitans]|uniref:Uncharacterized protein n=1 Tax=Nocardia rhizosphaerihabitans TaxID=1691570 RepID=A0ABQ2K6W0_9NOCA|nr:hypothetical protein [Nocardia rhizosphaerihabitans]GGN68845.1 hypothetical protein GCM10011610_06500 [Nocardia rhizosphaerihabitans]